MENNNTTFYFVRHADKEKGDFYNPRLRHQDQPISDYGMQQAAALENYFRDKPITSIYISQYIRTMQTVKPLADTLGVTPIIDERLNEIDNGLADGLTTEQFKAKFPDIWEIYDNKNSDFRWPGGETGEEAQARVTNFISEKKNRPGDVLVVTHEGLIRLLLCHILQIPVYRRFEFVMGTTGIFEIVHDREQNTWRMIRFNQEP